MTKREYSRDEPIAMADRDPGNSDPDQFTAPLEPEDNVYTRVNQEQETESQPVQLPRFE